MSEPQQIAVSTARQLISSGKLKPDDLHAAIGAGRVQIIDDTAGGGGPAAQSGPVDPNDPQFQPVDMNGGGHRYGNPDASRLDTLMEGGRALYDTAVGAGKAVMRTGYNIGKGVVNAAHGRPADAPINPDLEHAMEPEGPYQKTGAIVGDVLPFVATDGAAGMVDVPGAASAGAKALRFLGGVTKDAAIGAGITKAEGGNAVVGGVVGGVAGVAGRAIGAGAEKLAASGPADMYRALGPTTRVNKQLATEVSNGYTDAVGNKLPSLAANGIRGSRAAMLGRVDERLAGIGEALDDAAALHSGENVNIADADNALQAARNKYVYTKKVTTTEPIKGANGKQLVGPNNEPLTKTTTNDVQAYKTPRARAFVKNVDALRDVLADQADADGNVPIEKVQDLKQMWSEVAGGTNTYANARAGVPTTIPDGLAKLAHKKAADAIRGALSDQFPDIAKINAEYSFYKRAQKVLSDTILRTTGQSDSLGATVKGASAIGGSIGRGSGAGGVALHYAIVKNVSKLINSPAWLSTSSVVKDRLANAIAAGQVGTVANVVRSAMQGSAAAASTPSSSDIGSDTQQ